MKFRVLGWRHPPGRAPATRAPAAELDPGPVAGSRRGGRGQGGAASQRPRPGDTHARPRALDCAGKRQNFASLLAAPARISFRAESEPATSVLGSELLHVHSSLKIIRSLANQRFPNFLFSIVTFFFRDPTARTIVPQTLRGAPDATQGSGRAICASELSNPSTELGARCS